MEMFFKNLDFLIISKIYHKIMEITILKAGIKWYRRISVKAEILPTCKSIGYAKYMSTHKSLFVILTNFLKL